MQKLLTIFLVLVAFPLFVSPVRSEPYLTEEQKEMLLKDSRELEKSKEKTLTRKTSGTREQVNIVKLQNESMKSHKTGPLYLGVTKTHYLRTQSLQSIFNNADWSTPTYMNRSVSNRPIRQSQQLVTSIAPSSESTYLVTNTRSLGENASDAELARPRQDEQVKTFELVSGEPNQKEIDTPSHIKYLISLVVLRDEGKITETEYQQQKKEILARSLGENAFDEEMAHPPQNEQVEVLEIVSGKPNQKEIDTPSRIKDLISLAVLRDDGKITEAQYQQQKAEILTRK